VFKVILLVCFLDILGPLVLATGEAGLVGKSSDPPQVFEGQSYTSLPFDGLALNKATMNSMTQLGTTFAALVIVPLSDKVGRKPIMLLFLYGGAAVYGVLMVLGDVEQTGGFAYYGYCLCKLFAGILGGSKTLATVCIQDIFADPKQKAAKSQATMPLGVLGAAIGSIFGMIMFNATGRLMSGGWFSMGISLFGGLLFTFRVPFWLPPPKDSNAADKLQVQNAGFDPNTVSDHSTAFDMNACPKELPQQLYRQILLASFLDSIGTQGLFSALTLILFTRFVYFVENPSDAALTSFGLIVFILIGLIMAIPSLGKRGAGFNAVLGNGATGLAQLILIFMNQPAAFLTVLYIGISFSFFSTVSYMPMLIEICPPDQRGKVTGTYGAIGNFTGFVMPLLIAIMSDYASNEAALAICAVFSFLGFVASLPLVKRFPGKIPEVKLSDEEQAHIDGDPHYLSAAEINKINKERMAKGEPALNMRFGDYKNDEPYLQLIQKLGRRDFRDMRQHVNEMFDILKAGGPNAEALSRAARERIVADTARFDAGEFDEEAKEMGLWLAKYLWYNGHGWNKFTPMYKVMIMSAFPPLPRIDQGAELAEAMPAFLGWLDDEMSLVKDDPWQSYSMLDKYHTLKLH